MEISTDINAVKEFLQKKFTTSDVTVLPFNIGGKTDGILVYLESLVDKEAIGKNIMQPLSEYESEITIEAVNGKIYNPDKKIISELTEAVTEVLAGNTVLFADGLNKAISFSAKQFDKRAVAEPPTSTVVKGPREGFVESIDTNISLMRRKLKSADLIFEKLNVGKYSDTAVAVCYIDGVVKPGLKEKIIKKIKSIDIDAALDSSYVGVFLGDHKTSLFKQVGSTEKPDILAAKILEGRVGILVDGSPIALTVPYLLIEDMQSAEDYYIKPYRATIGRLIRLISIIISVLLPAFFVSAQLFHLQLIPLSFLLTIVNSIKGIPLSPSYEMFFTLLIFEVLNEASVRMPKYVGMVVSIVGGLVLGETAVNAGIISAPALMIIALSGICLYTAPELEKPFSVIRLVFLLVAGAVGGYGMLLVIAALLVYLASFENFGVPILAPYAPFIPHDLKDGFIKNFIFVSSERPEVLGSPNKTRMKIKNKDGKKKK